MMTQRKMLSFDLFFCRNNSYSMELRMRWNPRLVYEGGDSAAMRRY